MQREDGDKQVLTAAVHNLTGWEKEKEKKKLAHLHPSSMTPCGEEALAFIPGS